MNVSGTIGTYGGIDSHGAISSEDNIEGKDFVTHEKGYSGGTPYTRDLYSIKYRKITTSININDWNKYSDGVYQYAYIFNQTDGLSDKDILGIIPRKGNWNFEVQYGYMEDTLDNVKYISFETNNPKTYDIELTVLYV